VDGLYALAAALVITDLRTALQAMGGERRQVKRLFCPNAKLNVSSAYLRCQKFVAFTISSPPAAGFPGELGPAAVAPDFVHVVLSAKWRFAVMPLAVRDCGTAANADAIAKHLEQRRGCSAGHDQARVL